jgi:hypothetical protein
VDVDSAPIFAPSRFGGPVPGECFTASTQENCSERFDVLCFGGASTKDSETDGISGAWVLTGAASRARAYEKEV